MGFSDSHIYHCAVIGIYIVSVETYWYDITHIHKENEVEGFDLLKVKINCKTTNLSV